MTTVMSHHNNIYRFTLTFIQFRIMDDMFECGCGKQCATGKKFLDHLNRGKTRVCILTEDSVAANGWFASPCGFYTTSKTGLSRHIHRCKNERCVDMLGGHVMETRTVAQEKKNSYHRTLAQRRAEKKDGLMQTMVLLDEKVEGLVIPMMTALIKCSDHCLHRLLFHEKQAEICMRLYDMLDIDDGVVDLDTLFGELPREYIDLRKIIKGLLRVFHPDKEGAAELGTFGGDMLNALENRNGTCLQLMGSCIVKMSDGVAEVPAVCSIDCNFDLVRAFASLRTSAMDVREHARGM